MSRTLRFLANDLVVETGDWAGRPALDFIRGDLGLTGAKEGCREGDCGACAVLVGERPLAGGSGAAAVYKAVPSCILALGELEGRHLVTIEGLSAGAAAAGLEKGLTPVMRAFLEENASQCGFCSPGFIISLTAWLLAGRRMDEEGALEAVEGNLCRCTGYGSIRRAASRILKEFADLPSEPAARLAALAKAGVVPASLEAFADGRLLPAAPAGSDGAAPAHAAASAPAAGAAPSGGALPAAGSPLPALILGGGTDFYVRNTDPEPREGFRLLDADPRLKAIERRGSVLEVGAAVTVRDFFASPEVRAALAGVEAFEGRFASVLIRNRATLGGNVVNASPVADMTSILIALGASLRLERSGQAPRELALERLYLGYKRLDLAPGEIVAAFLIPVAGALRLGFEKASKRKSLDIAAVNTAAALELDGRRITRARISAGGVAATPLLLEATSDLLAGREVSAATAVEAARSAVSEVSPIGDVRGSAGYRIRVLERLVLAHFVSLFPEDRALAEGVAKEVLK